MTSPTDITAQLALFAVKASLVFGAAFVITALLRRAAATTRHAVWLAAFAGVLVLPVAGALVPSLSIAVPQALSAVLQPRSPVAAMEVAVPARFAPQDVSVASSSSNGRGASSLSYYRLKVTPSADVVAAGPAGFGGKAVASVAPAIAGVAYTPADASPAPWTMRVVLLWLFGCVMVAVAFAVGVLRTHILACQATPVLDGALADEVEVLSASLGIVRDVRVMTWDGPAMPMTWGAVRPVVLLPDAARDWPHDRRREVLTHELAHVARGDWTARLLAALVCALQWFNPLAWMAARRMRDEQELACDDAVLAGGAQPSAYAAHLLEVARSLRMPAAGMAGASVAMARPSQLTGRLLALLDASRRRAGPTPRAGLGMVWALMLLVVVPVSAMKPAQADRRAGGQAGRRAEVPVMAYVTTPTPAAMAVAPDRSADAAVAAVIQQDRCDMSARQSSRAGMSSGSGRSGNRTSVSAGSSSHSSSSSHDGSLSTANLSISQNGCTIEVKMRGAVRFTDDESDVAEVPRGGSVRVTQDDGSGDRRFDASWQGSRLARRFMVDGREVPEDESQRAWLKWALQTAFTRTGYNAIPRALRAYRAGGLDSALRLADASNSDYARRIIATALIDSVQVPPGEAARLARLTDQMSSDYERAELLIAVAQKLRLDGEVQDAMVNAAGSMSSDYERGRVLSAALARPDLSAEATRSLMRTAGAMSSDYEKAELLIRYLRGHPLDEARRAEFFSATRSISSDYEKRRLLSTVVSRASAPDAVIRDVAAAASGVGSDFERAELLVQIARKFGGNAEVRDLVRRSADGVSSDYERSRVLAELGRRDADR